MVGRGFPFSLALGIGVSILILILLLVIAFFLLRWKSTAFLLGRRFISFLFMRRRLRSRYGSAAVATDDSEFSIDGPFQFDLSQMQSATENFSAEKIIGLGGAACVYKGTLPNGQEIAVKRLYRSSMQSAEEFKKEIRLVAKLRHRNLVRLLGFCFHQEEKILVYEFLPNRSLDYFLFDPEEQLSLDWSRRYAIIRGIARGLLYLHEDSGLKIIHRDLKASNVLLDENMEAKIADFGLARDFEVDQSEAATSRIAGTLGYLAPEYFMYGHFSAKIDVFSFGVLVLEIIGGKRNSSFNQSAGAENLLSYAWKQWRDGTPLALVDQSLGDSYARDEVIKCIHIGLLCVQEDAEQRPPMASVVSVLQNDSVNLATPQYPPFVVDSTIAGNIDHRVTNESIRTSPAKGKKLRVFRKMLHGGLRWIQRPRPYGNTRNLRTVSATTQVLGI